MSIFLLLPLLVFCTDLEILFIGNSHTYFNDMPQMLDSLGDAGGHDLNVSMSVVGGSTLLFHYEYQPTLDSIAANNWDLVVIQEHSLLPVIPYWRDYVFFRYATHFDELISDQGAETVLFMTHARGNAQGEYCIDGHCSPDFEDYFDMQEMMAQSYLTLADSLSAILAPVGEVWEMALREVPFLPLWHADNSHASLEGGYLTACVFYQTLLGESPVDLGYHSSLPPERAAMYQRFASEAVSIHSEMTQPRVLGLSGFPNPFNGMVQIRFQNPTEQSIKLHIYDHLGRAVFHATERVLPSGLQSLSWDGRDTKGQLLPSGLYIARIEGPMLVGSCKVTLLK